MLPNLSPSFFLGSNVLSQILGEAALKFHLETSAGTDFSSLAASRCKLAAYCPSEHIWYLPTPFWEQLKVLSVKLCMAWIFIILKLWLNCPMHSDSSQQLPHTGYWFLLKGTWSQAVFVCWASGSVKLGGCLYGRKTLEFGVRGPGFESLCLSFALSPWRSSFSLGPTFLIYVEILSSLKPQVPGVELELSLEDCP